MALTLLIESKGIFGRVKEINIKEILEKCQLEFGSENEFYVLEENTMNEGTCVLYNPQRIGRGIYFDSRQVSVGKLTISINMPTTKAEINDFVKVAGEIERQFKKVSIYCVEQKKNYSVMSLEESKEEMAAFSLECLKSFCSNESFPQCVLTLTKYPWFMDEQHREAYKTCKDLEDFEKTLHELQAEDIYYAKPSLMRNEEDGKNYACYVLTTMCESIFPTDAKEFINLDRIPIDGGLIQFYNFEEDEMLDGIFPYELFVEYMQKQGVESFDAKHIRIPGNITVEDMYKMMEYMDK